MLVDDSGSMSSKIVEPGAQMNLFSSVQNQKTRWMEAQQAAVTLVNMITAVPTEHTFDVWFLNRGKVLNVTKPADLEQPFNTQPAGGTPLISSFRSIFNTYDALARKGTHVLILALSDGEPSSSDGTIGDLVYALTNKHRLFHVSFIQCSDNEDEMAFMDTLDGRVFNFHNSDDYRLEMTRVKNQQGSNYKYTYTDYIISAVLSTFIPSYFLLDQNRTARISIDPLPEMSASILNSLMDGVAFVDRVASNSGAVSQPNQMYYQQQAQQTQAVQQYNFAGLTYQQSQPTTYQPPVSGNSNSCCVVL
jgi:hypothetical protein